MILESIADLVRDANPNRNVANLDRRAVKMLEELGEVAQAWLNVSSASNGKGKTWDDVREEVADCLIVALDIALTNFGSEASWQPYFETNRESANFTDIVALRLFAITQELSAFGLSLQRRPDRGACSRMLDMVVNMALSRCPDQLDFASADIQQQLHGEVLTKLLKWTDSRAKMAVVTDDV